MLSRRLIRVKVFKILFGRIIAGSDSLVGAENELIASCEKTLDLYSLMLQLPILTGNLLKMDLWGYWRMM